MYFRKYFLFVIAFISLNINAQARTAPALQSLCPQYKPYSIDISSLADFYGTLTADEKEEQLRDWAFYGLLASLEVKPPEIGALNGMDFPMRYRDLKEKYRYPVLPGRAACPDGNDCVMLVARNGAEDKLLQGYIYDEFRMPAGEAPKRVHIFAYSVDPSSKTINTYYIRTVPGNVFLSPDYGYFEKEIAGAEDLKEFLGAVNALVSVKIRKDTAVLGGRKNRQGGLSSLAFEDVAVLHQAYISRNAAEKEKERRDNYQKFLTQKYDEVLRKDKNLRKAIKAGKIKYINIMTRIRKAFPYASLEEMDSNVGFSLDPVYDYDAIARELTDLSERTGRFAAIPKDAPVSKVIDSYCAAVSSTAAKVRSRRDITPLLKLRRGFTGSGNVAERQFDSALQDIEIDNTYQTARYDGRMKGTSAAMILFYTDLTAKLWALDYNGMAPKDGIAGFEILAGIKVPKLYWKDFARLSKTRLWFGLRSESFDINGGDIFFEPVSARVYAASSDPLYPGKESKPNYQSGEFLGWWDAHYAPVADYEPYYYKLNELLKWSCVMMVLKENKSHCLDFLGDAPVTRTLDFEAWYRDNGQLKSRTTLPFVDRKKFGLSVECFKMLQSKGYPLMGTTYFVSGGVSLASKNDIAAKISKHAAAGRAGGRKTAAGRTPEHKAKYAKVSAKGGKAAKTAAEEPEKNDFGEFSAAAGDRTIKLSWNRDEGAVLDECVNALVDVQMKAGGEGRSENIFREVKDFQKVVRIETGKTYLIRSGSLKDKWIYLSIDPEGKTSGFTAKAAGSEPDSSIFYAKTMPLPQAQKLIEQYKAVTLF